MTADFSDLIQSAVVLIRDGYAEWVSGVSGEMARSDSSSVEDVFTGTWATADEVIEHGRTLGVVITRRCLVAVATARDGARADKLYESLSALPWSPRRGVLVGLLRGTPVPHVPAVMALPEDAAALRAHRSLAEWADENDAIVLVEEVDDVTAARSLYFAMREELRLGVAAASGPGLIDRERDLRVPRLLQRVDVEDAEPFVRTALGGVLERPPTTAELLLETLHALFSWDGGIEDLADALALSISGLRSRLARVRDLTHRHHTRDRVELLLALVLFRIHRLRLPPVGDPRWVR